MHDFLLFTRAAFRRAYGLPDADGGRRTSQGIPGGLFEFGREHRILGLLESGLSISNCLAGEEASKWQRAVFGQARYSSQCTSEAERIAPVLSDKLGFALLLKGPALAAQAWPDVGLRHFDDLDFRIPPTSLTDLCEIMHASGYEATIGNERRRLHLWHYGWGISFKNNLGLILEFNHRFFPPQYPGIRGFTPEALPHGMQKLDQIAAQTLLPSDHLVYTCMHALWHGWERLAWMVDIAGLMIKNPGALEAARKRSGKRTFARRALEAAVDISSTLFGLGLPAADLDHIPAGYAGTILDRYNRSMHLSLADQRRAHFTLMRPHEKINYELRRAFIPGDGDFSALSLPPIARGAYWLLRPLRIAASPLLH